jgi:sigma-B regulation protein RsbU (phosphoserine phosphatase)
MWRHADSGEIDEMKNTGIMLGALTGSTYTESEPVTLEPGDIVVIGTDGIWEARNPDKEMFGKDRLRRVINDNASCPAGEIQDRIIDEVKAFCGTHPQLDDITVVVIKAL